MTDNELLESICPKPLIDIANKMVAELKTLDPHNLKYYLMTQLVTAYELNTLGEAKFYSVSFVEKTVSEWDHIDGSSTKSFDSGFNFRQNSTSLDGLIDKLCDHIGTTDYEINDDYHDTIEFTTIEDDNCLVLTLDEQESCHKQGLKMYLCDYSIKITCSTPVNIKQTLEKEKSNVQSIR